MPSAITQECRRRPSILQARLSAPLQRRRSIHLFQAAQRATRLVNRSGVRRALAICGSVRGRVSRHHCRPEEAAFSFNGEVEDGEGQLFCSGLIYSCASRS